MKKYLWIIIAGCLFMMSCQNNSKHPVNFYYWKTNVSLGEVEQSYFKGLQCSTLYMRFFDVDIQNSTIEPVAKVVPFDSKALVAAYVPVVFITNRTFLDISEAQITALATNITELIEKICAKNALPSVTEIQIDCDWTEKTKSAYFQFLKTLKETSGKNITCTIRLHQIKFKEKTGIPPVGKGYLMCYATSDPRESADRNSILDISLLKDYTANINSYPLDFDVALPIYSWAVVTNHVGQIKLINNVTSNDLDTTSFKPLSESAFEVKEDFFFQGFYLNKGFKLRLENITPALLSEARQYLNGKIKKPYSIVYYHLDEPFLKQFSLKELSE